MLDKIDFAQYIPQMIEDIQGLVRIPSIRDDEAATTDAPYGPEVRKALDLGMFTHIPYTWNPKMRGLTTGWMLLAILTSYL